MLMLENVSLTLSFLTLFLLGALEFILPVEKPPDSLLNVVKNSSGLVYEQLMKIDMALGAHQKTLEIFTRENNEQMMADVGVNFGVASKS